MLSSLSNCARLQWLMFLLAISCASATALADVVCMLNARRQTGCHVLPNIFVHLRAAWYTQRAYFISQDTVKVAACQLQLRMLVAGEQAHYWSEHFPARSDVWSCLLWRSALWRAKRL